MNIIYNGFLKYKLTALSYRWGANRFGSPASIITFISDTHILYGSWSLKDLRSELYRRKVWSFCCRKRACRKISVQFVFVKWNTHRLRSFKAEAPIKIVFMIFYVTGTFAPFCGTSTDVIDLREHIFFPARSSRVLWGF